MHLIFKDGFCIVHIPFFFVWSDLNFLYNSQWITFPTQSYLVLYSFCTNLLHLFIMWLIISPPHNLHQLFCCILSIFALTYLNLMVLLCVVIRRDSASLLRVPFLSHVQVFSWDFTYLLLKMSMQLFLFPFLFSGFLCSCLCGLYCFWWLWSVFCIF